MIKRIKIENFRSFVKAEAELQPFTLVIGANGAGKSNLLRWFSGISSREPGKRRRNVIPFARPFWKKHLLHGESPESFAVEFSRGGVVSGNSTGIIGDDFPWAVGAIPVFNLDPQVISGEETIIPNPAIGAAGGGTVRVLDALKNGDREDLFRQIEENFRHYVPEVEKLSLLTTSAGEKAIQVREQGLGGKTLPASELSEGTRLILCILTIIHQENPPPVILLEDIDRGMHPRLFEHVAPLMRRIAEEHDINIIATTHNPYLVDAFQDAKECVLLVEKVDGASVLVPLTERLKEMNYDEVESDMPLGHLWYSGLIGGVPVAAAK